MVLGTVTKLEGVSAELDKQDKEQTGTPENSKIPDKETVANKVPDTTFDVQTRITPVTPANLDTDANEKTVTEHRDATS